MILRSLYYLGEKMKKRLIRAFRTLNQNIFNSYLSSMD